MKYIAVSLLVTLFACLMACEQFKQATSPGPGWKCNPYEVDCSDAWGGCCPPGHECRSPIPEENRPAFCANVDGPRGWSTVGVQRTPKAR